jgi:hypothetical protein
VAYSLSREEEAEMVPPIQSLSANSDQIPELSDQIPELMDAILNPIEREGKISPAPAEVPKIAELDWLNRPEAVVFILFMVLLVLWQTYLKLTEEPDSETFLSGRKLALRLGVSSSTVVRRKQREDFSLWSRNLDPEGISWIYSSGKFLPVPQIGLT